MTGETIVKKESCGCEFTTSISDDGQNSFTTLTRCRCQKHYDEQLKAEWYGHEGHHSVIRKPEEVAGLVPLEKFYCISPCGASVWLCEFDGTFYEWEDMVMDSMCHDKTPNNCTPIGNPLGSLEVWDSTTDMIIKQAFKSCDAKSIWIHDEWLERSDYEGKEFKIGFNKV